MSNTPAIIQEPLSPDLIKQIALDIGKSTVDYIEYMYPKAIEATSSTFKTSIKHHICNQIMAAIKLTDENKIAANLKNREKHRRHMRKLRKAKSMDDIMELKKEGDEILKEMFDIHA